MKPAANPTEVDGQLIVYFSSDGIMRSRSVSPLVLQATLDIPPPPARLIADWNREVADLGLEIGDIESLPLARTIVRWPDYSRCVAAVSGWMQTQGLGDLLDPSDLALMACRGVHYHYDAEQYAGSVFCNLFLSEDKALDLHFPVLDLRIPLSRGTAVIFDTAQPHAVIPRGRSSFNATDFAPDQDCTQAFLTWELPVENAHIAAALRIDFGLDAQGVSGPDSVKRDEQGVRLNGISVTVCPETGRWSRSA